MATPMPDLLTHALLAYTLCRALAVRYQWLDASDVTVGMSGPLHPKRRPHRSPPPPCQSTSGRTVVTRPYTPSLHTATPRPSTGHSCSPRTTTRPRLLGFRVRRRLDTAEHLKLLFNRTESIIVLSETLSDRPTKRCPAPAPTGPATEWTSRPASTSRRSPSLTPWPAVRPGASSAPSSPTNSRFARATSKSMATSRARCGKSTLSLSSTWPPLRVPKVPMTAN